MLFALATFTAVLAIQIPFGSRHRPACPKTQTQHRPCRRLRILGSVSVSARAAFVLLAAAIKLYSLAALNMGNGRMASDSENGIGHPIKDLCGASVGGTTITCNGDITARCSSYGVARYGSTTCRTYCPDQGDPVFCVNVFDGEWFSGENYKEPSLRSSSVLGSSRGEVA